MATEDKDVRKVDTGDQLLRPGVKGAAVFTSTNVLLYSTVVSTPAPPVVGVHQSVPASPDPAKNLVRQETRVMDVKENETGERTPR